MFSLTYFNGVGYSIDTGGERTADSLIHNVINKKLLPAQTGEMGGDQDVHEHDLDHHKHHGHDHDHDHHHENVKKKQKQEKEEREGEKIEGEKREGAVKITTTKSAPITESSNVNMETDQDQPPKSKGTYNKIIYKICVSVTFV